MKETSTTESGQDLELKRLLDNFLELENSSKDAPQLLGVKAAADHIARAIARSDFKLEDCAAVSGIPGPVNPLADLDIDTFQTTKGRAIPFATGLHLAQSKLKIVILGTDKDLFYLGGSHFMQAGRRNLNISVICINNFNYHLEETPDDPAEDATVINAGDLKEQFDNFFNLTKLAHSAGAVYVARWTALHGRQITDSIIDCLNKPGFSFVEILAPCSDQCTPNQEVNYGTEELKLYFEKSNILTDAPIGDTDIGPQGIVPVGIFSNIDKPTYIDNMSEHFLAKFGSDYSYPF